MPVPVEREGRREGRGGGGRELLLVFGGGPVVREDSSLPGGSDGEGETVEDAGEGRGSREVDRSVDEGERG